MSQLDRRDQLPDYYADLTRMPSRSARVHKRLCWNERFKDMHLKEIEKLRKKTVVSAQKEALSLYEKLNYFEDLKRKNPNEIDRIEKLKEKNRLSFLTKKKEFYETIEKLEKGIFEPMQTSSKIDNENNREARLKSAIKQSRSSSSKTNKSVTFNLSANKIHGELSKTNDNINYNHLNENKMLKNKNESLSDLYKIPDAFLPELGEDITFKEVLFRNRSKLIKKINIDK